MLLRHDAIHNVVCAVDDAGGEMKVSTYRIRGRCHSHGCYRRYAAPILVALISSRVYSIL